VLPAEAVRDQETIRKFPEILVLDGEPSVMYEILYGTAYWPVLANSPIWIWWPRA
jgi:hypothetical protein